MAVRAVHDDIETLSSQKCLNRLSPLRSGHLLDQFGKNVDLGLDTLFFQPSLNLIPGIFHLRREHKDIRFQTADLFLQRPYLFFALFTLILQVDLIFLIDAILTVHLLAECVKRLPLLRRLPIRLFQCLQIGVFRG